MHLFFRACYHVCYMYVYMWDSANVVFVCSPCLICPVLIKAGITLQDQIAVVQPFSLRNLHYQVGLLRVYSNVVFSFSRLTPPLPLMAVLTCVIDLVHSLAVLLAQHQPLLASQSR